MIMSDFCYKPYAMVLSLAGNNGTVHDLAQYYTSCNGTDPFASSFDEALRA
jgi:hypothetical protein